MILLASIDPCEQSTRARDIGYDTIAHSTMYKIEEPEYPNLSNWK